MHLARVRTSVLQGVSVAFLPSLRDMLANAGMMSMQWMRGNL